MDKNKGNITRRLFLKLSSALAVASVSGATHADLISRPAFQKSQSIQRTALKDLKISLSGDLVTAAHKSYGALFLPNNLVYRNIRPLGIALCKNESDISRSLEWCKKHNVSLITRNGGHSYAGYSTTRGLMINIQALNNISYNKALEEVRIGAGANSAQIYNALQEINRTLTHGRCLGVGMGAFLLGGGVGFNMRRFGVGSDLMTQTEMVLANGLLIRANMTENKDLFWACRGVGGGNLGINTSFNISVFPANEIVVFKINWSNVSDQFLENMFAALESSQRELGHQIYLKPEAIGGRSSSISAYMFGQFAGPVSQFNEIISQINSAQSPSSSVIQELPYWEGQRFISDTGVPAYYRFRSRFVNSGITHQMISLLRRNLANWKNTSGNGYVKLYQTGGAVNDIAPEATAFVHRSSQWMADVSIDWKGGQSASSVNAAQRWQDHFYNEITKLSGGGAYQNFVDRTLKDWEKAYYGQNADRLKSIKLRVDPDDQFHFQQSIRL